MYAHRAAEAEREIANEVLAGALQGDSNNDLRFWSDIGQIVTGLIPVTGQLGDLRDLVHIVETRLLIRKDTKRLVRGQS